MEYRKGSCWVIKSEENQARVTMISKYEDDSDLAIEIHIVIDDPYPEIEIDDLISGDGDFITIEDRILEEISEEEYIELTKMAIRSQNTE